LVWKKANKFPAGKQKFQTRKENVEISLKWVQKFSDQNLEIQNQSETGVKNFRPEFQNWILV
jgi:hypothetical protein